MHRPASTWRVLLVSLLVAATGCAPTQPFFLHEDGDLSHYIDRATQAEHPDLHAAPLHEVTDSLRPLSLAHPEYREEWHLSLEECISIALKNTKILRGGTTQGSRIQNGQLNISASVDSLVEQPLGATTTYNPAIVESNPGQQIGGLSNFLNNGAGGAFNGPTTDGGVANVRQGVEAALAEFDAQLSVTGDPGGLISTQDRPQNFIPSANSRFFPRVQRTTNGGMDTTLSKRTAEGTLYQVTSSTDYTRGNTRGFPIDPATGTGQPLFSTWTQVIQIEARHPLLRGRGSQINRMPIIIARIGTDIELATVQDQLQEMLDALEFRYWDLYRLYRNLETTKVARDSALVTWRIVYDKFKADVEPVQAEAQAQEQYYNFKATLEDTLRQLYDSETELRFLMGLAPTDGRLIRPKDDPTLARVEFDWTEILAEAIARRPELTQQRWRIKQRELELILARNLLLPQLDVGAQYRWLGLGDDLIHATRNGVDFPSVIRNGVEVPGVGSTAWEELTGGKYQEFSFLMQYQMPIGFRRELAAVRHAQLRLAREKALLEDMELDVAHGLSKALRNLETNFQVSQTQANRWAAAENEVKAREALYVGGRTSLDDVLQAQQRRAFAQQAFWGAVVGYNQAIADLHTRKGSILDYDGIGFAEGDWPQKAYWDALARARERDAGWYIDYGWTRPKVISSGPIPQGLPASNSLSEAAAPTTAEDVASPEPTPADPATQEREPSVLPTPRVVPQETRVPSRSVDGPRTSAIGQRTGQVSRASFTEMENPLRGNREVIGSGLVNE